MIQNKLFNPAISNNEKKVADKILKSGFWASGSGIFSEIYSMRKTVVDDSNTIGFQHTMLISQGGSYSLTRKKRFQYEI